MTIPTKINRVTSLAVLLLPMTEEQCGLSLRVTFASEVTGYVSQGQRNGKPELNEAS